ncbi:hypothetical protein DFH07DRAFT_769774 [Mycena maculata]|uniref:Uncharacterized protein n=1 Tax=Mycena maculata TaxID=230809 RepID=A0AAD7JKM6_9AGAR|nr:hypothetical protein DFH07DRAFT_769774 [Mycena maculata]
MSALVPTPPPATKLGQLATRASIHVSPLALGGMSIGDKWVPWTRSRPSRSLMRVNSQDGSSEAIIGECVEARGSRGQLAIATKYTCLGNPRDDSVKQRNLYIGNNIIYETCTRPWRKSWTGCTISSPWGRFVVFQAPYSVTQRDIEREILPMWHHEAPFVFPIVGGRKVEHLMANIEALDIMLSAEQIAYIEGVLPFDKGFPTT